MKKLLVNWFLKTGITPKRKYNTFSAREKIELINKFSGELVYPFAPLYKDRKNFALVEFYNAAVQRILKMFREKSVTETIFNKVSDLQNVLSHGGLPVRFPNTSLWLLRSIELKHIPLSDNTVQC